MVNNPFFNPYDTPFNIPPFEQIKAGHYVPAFKEGIRRQQKEIEAIVADPAPPGFSNTVEALENSGRLLKEVKSVFEVLRAAHTNERLQKSAWEASALLASHRDDIYLNPGLFKKIRTLHKKKDRLNLTEEQYTLLDDYYKEFVRGGANLNPAKQARLREINEELSRLKVSFENNLLDETNRFVLIIEDPGVRRNFQERHELSGLLGPGFRACRADSAGFMAVRIAPQQGVGPGDRVRCHRSDFPVLHPQ